MITNFDYLINIEHPGEGLPLDDKVTVLSITVPLRSGLTGKLQKRFDQRYIELRLEEYVNRISPEDSHLYLITDEPSLARFKSRMSHVSFQIYAVGPYSDVFPQNPLEFYSVLKERERILDAAPERKISILAYDLLFVTPGQGISEAEERNCKMFERKLECAGKVSGCILPEKEFRQRAWRVISHDTPIKARRFWEGLFNLGIVLLDICRENIRDYQTREPDPLIERYRNAGLPIPRGSIRSGFYKDILLKVPSSISSLPKEEQYALIFRTMGLVYKNNEHYDESMFPGIIRSGNRGKRQDFCQEVLDMLTTIDKRGNFLDPTTDVGDLLGTSMAEVKLPLDEMNAARYLFGLLGREYDISDVTNEQLIKTMADEYRVGEERYVDERGLMGSYVQYLYLNDVKDSLDKLLST